MGRVIDWSIWFFRARIRSKMINKTEMWRTLSGSIRLWIQGQPHLAKPSVRLFSFRFSALSVRYSCTLNFSIWFSLRQKPNRTESNQQLQVLHRTEERKGISVDISPVVTQILVEILFLLRSSHSGRKRRPLSCGIGPTFSASRNDNAGAIHCQILY